MCYVGPNLLEDLNEAHWFDSLWFDPASLNLSAPYDANSGFYGKGKKSVYDQVANSPMARRHISRCGYSLDLEVVE